MMKTPDNQRSFETVDANVDRLSLNEVNLSSTARIETVHLLLLAYRSQWAMTTRQHGIRVQ